MALIRDFSLGLCFAAKQRFNSHLCARICSSEPGELIRSHQQRLLQRDSAPNGSLQKQIQPSMFSITKLSLARIFEQPQMQWPHASFDVSPCSHPLDTWLMGLFQSPLIALMKFLGLLSASFALLPVLDRLRRG